MVDFSLKDKVALVTGASRGIGEAIAITLSEHGARCILASRKIEELEKVKSNIEKSGGQADAYACHTGNLSQISDLFEKIDSHYGRLDILVNNAATSPYFGDMVNADERAWDKTNGVNLKGPFFIIQHAAGLMERSGGGAIVNVASINGVRPIPIQGIYSITKAGLISMTKAYAKELATKNIRVNALCPGPLYTELLMKYLDTEAKKQRRLVHIPMGRFGQAAEIAKAALFLASDESSFTTGATFTVDGGITAAYVTPE